MILKIIFLLIVIYYLYKLFGGKIELPKKKSQEEKEIDENTLVECSKCGVYITYKEAKIVHKKIICSDCAKEL